MPRNFACLVSGLVLSCIALFGCAPSLKQVQVSESAAQVEAEKQKEMAVALWAKRENRLGTIAYRLSRAASDLCGKTRAAYGFLAHDRSSYQKEYQAAAARVFGLGDRPVVRYVESGFPAAVAGLQVGDTLEAIAGKDLTGKNATQALQIFAKHASVTDPMQVKVRRGGQIVDLTMLGVLTCDYPAAVTQDDIVNAFADGEKVYIAAGMMRFAETDDELALVVAHEIAHNALDHIGKKKGNALLGGLVDALVAGTTGVNTGGVFSSAGAQAFSQGFESEADYAGLYMVARAGYDIVNAPTFWRRMAAEHPGSIKKSFMASHPSTPERFLALENTVTEIAQKQQSGKPLDPEK